MQKAGIQTKNWHRQFKPLPNVSQKAPCFRIWLKNDGSIASIDEINADTAKLLRKWEPDLGTSFPAFNMPSVEEWESKNGKVKLEKCLKKCPGEFLKKTKKEGNAVNQLIKILLGHDIFPALKDYLARSDIDSESLKAATDFSKSAKPSIVLDVYNYKSFGVPVVSEESMEWMNKILISEESSDNKNTSDNITHGQDAFGNDYISTDEPMPEVKLPELAGVKLRSMFDDKECQFRYGFIGSDSYPINKNDRAFGKGAFEWLSDTSLKGQTWIKSDDKELLFAYPSVLNKPVDITSMLGGDEDETKVADGGDSNTAMRFAEKAEQVTSALKSLKTDGNPVDIEMFAIHKMDKARSKVVYYRNYTAQRLIDFAKEWIAGCANIPDIGFKCWPAKSAVSGKDAKPEIRKPFVPKPLNSASVFNTVWKRDGTQIPKNIERIRPCQCLDMMLEDDKPLYDHALSTLLQNANPLIFYLGNFVHMVNKQGYTQAFESKKIYSIVIPSLMTVSMFGLLLYKLNIHKEKYMESLPYSIGQMLKASDELHALYCNVMRDGSMPPQLAGSALLSAALDAPVQTVAQLAQRMNPYLSWAKTYRYKKIDEKGKESWKAGWYMNVYQGIADKLKETIPENACLHFVDSDKAQVFIGYLASFPKMFLKKEEKQTQGEK
jgi:hypothetical protein